MINPIAREPGACHPGLEEYPFLRDWIEERGPYQNMPNVRYAISPPIPALLDPDPTGPSMEVGYVTKHKFRMPAPYVGRPFCYWWWVGVDQLDRAISSNVVQHRHLMDHFEFSRYLTVPQLEGGLYQEGFNCEC